MKKPHCATICLRTFLAATLTGGWLASTVFAGPAPFYSDAPGAPADAARAIRICETLDSTLPAERQPRLAQGIALAERAVRRFPDDPRAQFALFCTLGRSLEEKGPSMRALFEVRRVRHAVQKAVALQPTYIDALVAHGAMLGRLPWLMGGDTERGEALIRHAIGLDPAFLPAYRELAALLHADGRGDEAPILDVARAAD
jgi:hypothetical protein